MKISKHNETMLNLAAIRCCYVPKYKAVMYFRSLESLCVAWSYITQHYENYRIDGVNSMFHKVFWNNGSTLELRTELKYDSVLYWEDELGEM